MELSGVVTGISLHRPVAEIEPIYLDEEDMAFGAYVDNIILLGVYASVIDSGLKAAIQHCNKVGLRIGDWNAARRRAKELGVVFDGNDGTIRHPPAQIPSQCSVTVVWRATGARVRAARR